MSKKNKFGGLSGMLTKTLCIVCLAAMLSSCGSSDGYSYSVGGTVDGLAGSGLVLQNNGGDDLSISANGSFTFSKAVANESNYAVTIKTQPRAFSQTCTVSNGSGTIDTSPVRNVIVSCVTLSPRFVVDPSGNPSGRFAYMVNRSSNTILAYTINQTTGALTAGTTLATGVDPDYVTIHPSGKFVYASNTSSNNISVYKIDPVNGALTAGTPVDAGTNPAAVTIIPIIPSNEALSGKFAYVANRSSNTISVYAIDQDNGALTTVGTPVETGTNPNSVTIDPSGTFAYVANYSSNTISVYKIDPVNGALTNRTDFWAGTNPNSVTIDPWGKYAYTANYDFDTISVYAINPVSGALTAVGAPVETGTNPNSVTIDPSGTFAYVANYRSNNISVYTIQATGALIDRTDIPAGTNPYAVVIHPLGKFAYVLNAVYNTITVYKIETTGALTPVSP